MHIKKILTYDVYAETTGTDRYKRVCNLLNQIIDPDTLKPDSIECNEKHVLISSRKRALSCTKKDSASSISVSPELNEIAFPLQEFCSEEDFLKGGSTAVREAFVQAFIKDKLETSHKKLQLELRNIVTLSKQMEQTLCISHTFRMKLLEIYANIGDDLFQNPTIIKEHIDCKKHLYDFGEIIEI